MSGLAMESVCSSSTTATAAVIGKSHEWPERTKSISSLRSQKYLLERTNSTGSLNIALYKESLEKGKINTIKITLKWIKKELKRD